MRNFFTPVFLKFFTRFIMILLIGVIGVLVFGNINVKQKEARIFQSEGQFQSETHSSNPQE